MLRSPIAFRACGLDPGLDRSYAASAMQEKRTLSLELLLLGLSGAGGVRPERAK